MKDNNESEGIVPVSRRRVLKAGAVSAVGVGLFSGTASATDDSIDFTVECLGDEVKVTLIRLLDFEDGSEVDPSTLEDLKVVFGKVDVIDTNGNGSIDRLADIQPCVKDDPDCQPAATADGSEADVRSDGGLCFTFSREEAGLDDVTGTVDVAFAGTYFNADRSRELGSFDGVTTFDPATCCVECESGEELLVKYEYDEDEGEFFIEKGGDDDISIESVTFDDEGEPQEACFSTTYCDLDAVVKAGTDYEVNDPELRDDGDRESEFCVEGIQGKAISNIRFYCEAPDDLSVGDGNGNGGGNGKGKGR